MHQMSTAKGHLEIYALNSSMLWSLLQAQKLGAGPPLGLVAAGTTISKILIVVVVVVLRGNIIHEIRFRPLA